jgi:hypothetical protein
MKDEKHLKSLIENKINNYIFANSEGEILGVTELIEDLSDKILSERDRFAIEKVDNVLDQLADKIKPFKEDALNTCADLMKQGKDETEEFNVAAALNSHYSIMLSYIKSFHSQKQTQG